MSQTIAQWLRQSTLPKIEANMLLQYASGYNRVQLITQSDVVLSEEILAKLTQLSTRRMMGEPMAYILGEREFYGRMFDVNSHVLIPRPETEHLVEAAIEKLPLQGKLWDLGTGSGAIAITIALERPDAKISASDISKEALQTAYKNAEKLGAKVAFAYGSWFEAHSIKSMQTFDVIVSNPPYIEHDDEHLKQGDLRHEPQMALTDFSDGLSCIRQLASGAFAYLAEGGWLLMEHGYNQGEAVRAILKKQGFTYIQTIQDLAGLDRITLGQMSKK